MRKIVVFLLLFGFSAIAENASIDWVWKNDPFFDKYKTGQEFGVCIEDGKPVYKHLWKSGARNHITAIKRPVRTVNGEFVDLSPRFKYEELKKFYQATSPGLRIGRAPMPEWVKLRVDVSQVLNGEGFIFYMGNGRFRKGPFFLQTTLTDGIVDDDTLEVYARQMGTYQYQSVLGAPKTVTKYIYGELDPDDYLEACMWIKSQYAKKEEKPEASE